MAFDFSCTSCGIPITQETVLFDFLNALREEETEAYRYLKLYFRKDKLEKLMADGEDLGEKNLLKTGHIRCRLSFEEMLALMGNEDNLNIPDLVKVSYEEVAKFSDWGKSLEKENFSTEENSDEQLTKDEEEELRKERNKVRAEARKAAQAEFEKSILSLIVKRQGDNQASKDIADRMDDLRLDFINLKRFIQIERHDGKDIAYISFVINPNYCKVSMSGEQILTGYQIYDDWGNLISSRLEARVCPNCHEVLFEGAGTAQQRTVMFIGSQKTGKTSTILSLAHYLQYRHMETSDPDMLEAIGIWKNKEQCAVREIRLANTHERMENELKGFSKGIAPAKTDRRGKGVQAYSVTLKVNNKDGEPGKESFLSMLDVPGEICDENTGHIDEVEATKFTILNHCDAYVLCFEHPIARKEREAKEAEEKKKQGNAEMPEKAGINASRGSVMTKEQMVCNWATEIQQMRKRQNKSVGFVPMMLLFTKCPQLEDSGQENDSDVIVDQKDHYLFKDERCAIHNNSQDNMFTPLLNTFKNSASLKEAFYSTMRCSPFGFRANKADEQKEGDEQTPNPQNIEKLMRWILYVTGCVPLEVNIPGIKKYYINPPEFRNLLPEEKYALDNQRTQSNDSAQEFWILHQLNLAKSLFGDEWKAYAAIAKARWMLFENFNPREREYANNANNKFKLHQAAVEANNYRRKQERKNKK